MPAARPITLALTVGDPAGIGPELVQHALADPDLASSARLVVLGPPALRPSLVPEVGTFSGDGSDPGSGHVWIPTEAPSSWELGRVQAGCGRAALAALRAGAELAHQGTVDALVTAPVSKEALHLAGAKVEGQTALLGEWAEAPKVQMLAVANQLRVLLLTRHLPLTEALSAVTQERVLDHLALLDRSLRGFGFAEPRLALAGLNPHAGEHGILGTEEIEILEPAAAEARGEGIDVTGPLSPDTVFVRASRGEFDAVLALYHDQAFIPVKLAAPETGFTVLCGLPYLRFSPAHGTAFDIAGKGIASPAGLMAALHEAVAWSRRKRGVSGVAEQ